MSVQERIEQETKKIKELVKKARRSDFYITVDMGIERWEDYQNHIHNWVARIWVDHGDYVSEAMLVVSNPLDILAVEGENLDEDGEPIRFKTENFDAILHFEWAVITEYLNPLPYREYKCKHINVDGTDVIRCVSQGVTRYLIFRNDEVIALLRLTKLKPKVKIMRLKGTVVRALQVLFGITDP